MSLWNNSNNLPHHIAVRLREHAEKWKFIQEIEAPWQDRVNELEKQIQNLLEENQKLKAELKQFNDFSSLP